MALVRMEKTVCAEALTMVPTHGELKFVMDFALTRSRHREIDEHSLSLSFSLSLLCHKR